LRESPPNDGDRNDRKLALTRPAISIPHHLCNKHLQGVRTEKTGSKPQRAKQFLFLIPWAINIYRVFQKNRAKCFTGMSYKSFMTGTKTPEVNPNAPENFYSSSLEQKTYTECSRKTVPNGPFHTGMSN